jgi:Na+/pantothenate symporter
MVLIGYIIKIFALAGCLSLIIEVHRYKEKISSRKLSVIVRAGSVAGSYLIFSAFIGGPATDLLIGLCLVLYCDVSLLVKKRMTV